MDTRAWIEIGLTAVIGATAVFVAWRQLRLERKRDDRELWDRRLVVCDAVYKFLDAASQTGMPIEPHPTDLMRATESPRLEIVFDDAAATRLIQVRERAHELWTTVHLEKSTPAGPQQVSYTAKRLEIVSWMEGQRPEFKKWLLSKYRLRR